MILNLVEFDMEDVRFVLQITLWKLRLADVLDFNNHIIFF